MTNCSCMHDNKYLEFIIAIISFTFELHSWVCKMTRSDCKKRRGGSPHRIMWCWLVGPFKSKWTSKLAGFHFAPPKYKFLSLSHTKQLQTLLDDLVPKTSTSDAWDHKTLLCAQSLGVCSDRMSAECSQRLNSTQTHSQFVCCYPTCPLSTVGTTKFTCCLSEHTLSKMFSLNRYQDN